MEPEIKLTDPVLNFLVSKPLVVRFYDDAIERTELVQDRKLDFFVNEESVGRRVTQTEWRGPGIYQFFFKEKLPYFYDPLDWPNLTNPILFEEIASLLSPLDQVFPGPDEWKDYAAKNEAWKPTKEAAYVLWNAILDRVPELRKELESYLEKTTQLPDWNLLDEPAVQVITYAYNADMSEKAPAWDMGQPAKPGIEAKHLVWGLYAGSEEVRSKLDLTEEQVRSALQNIGLKNLPSPLPEHAPEPHKEWPQMTPSLIQVMQQAQRLAEQEGVERIDPIHLYNALFGSPPDHMITKLIEEHQFPRQLSTPFSMRSMAHTDFWTLDDRLGYDVYAEAIALPILEGATRPPIAIAVQAPWGQGKSTLMRMIQQRLESGEEDEKEIPLVSKPDQKKPKPVQATFKDVFHWMDEPLATNQLMADGRRLPCVWFNPLYFHNTEQVWAGLAHAILTQLSGKLPDQITRERFWLNLHLSRINKDAIRRDVYKDVLWKFIPKALAYGGISLLFLVAGFLADMKMWGSGATAAAWLAAAIDFFREKSNAADWNLHERYQNYVREPNYEDRLGFLHLVDQDLDRALNILVGEEPFAVFIDDLDRCPPDTISEVVMAINQFLSVTGRNAIFFLGMDMEPVAEALEKAQGKTEANTSSPLGNSFGWEFMDKFIQLPFFIPRLDEDNAKRFLGHLLAPPSEQAESDMIAPVPTPVPSPSPKPPASPSVPWASPTPPISQETLDQWRRQIESADNEEELDRTLDAIKASNLPDPDFDLLYQEMESRRQLFQVEARVEAAASIEELTQVREAARETFKGNVGKEIEDALTRRSSHLLAEPDSRELPRLVEIAVRELDYNPRTLKRFINLASLLRTILAVKGTSPDPDYERRLVVRGAHLVLNWPRIVRWIQGNQSKYNLEGERVKASQCLSEWAKNSLEDWQKQIAITWGEPVCDVVGNSRFYRFLKEVSDSPPGFSDLLGSPLFTCKGPPVEGENSGTNSPLKPQTL